MAYLISMFQLLLIGMSILMAGSFFLNSDSALNPRWLFKDSLVWGAGFFVAFTVEFLVLVLVL